MEDNETRLLKFLQMIGSVTVAWAGLEHILDWMVMLLERHFTTGSKLTSRSSLSSKLRMARKLFDAHPDLAYSKDEAVALLVDKIRRLVPC
jgi:hypothetical protein